MNAPLSVVPHPEVHAVAMKSASPYIVVGIPPGRSQLVKTGVNSGGVEATEEWVHAPFRTLDKIARINPSSPDSICHDISNPRRDHRLPQIWPRMTAVKRH